MVVFLQDPAGRAVKTNNHVERANRQWRFQEKARYKWRSARSLHRFLCLRLAYLEDPAAAGPSAPRLTPEQVKSPSGVAHAAGD
jgi:hypothetical protein